GESARAEQALRRAVQAVERMRDTQHGDTFKSWLLAARRAPFEDLFLYYVSGRRLADALEVVQRATARSTLDGLLESPLTESSPARGIVAAGAWSEGMHKLARALRASRAMATPPIDAVLARLRGNHVITYFRARGELWAIAIAADGTLHATKIGGVADIGARVAAWRRHPEDTGVADQLGSVLLPDELVPPPGAPLFVVEEDPIADVSIAALRRHGQLMLDQHAVAYAPSAAVLSATRRTQSAIRALVLGDPTGDLPQAREEAKEVADRLKVTPRLGADAARAAVLDASEATLIHIAAHTVPTETGTALRLADGLLDAGTVIDHGVAAGAIVLLTCSSAPITSHDELAPLASAFIAAGAHTVVASRWAIPDDVALSFARMFYEANGIDNPVAAVAAAQRELVRRGVPVEQWATFALIGGLP
ncbi:MAG TPA: CHAT domain-containing protein, partial [Kofleriaceae bacterium]|nr:CHAT domain-containing protein [Kofleriaceae bacterium]